jgi:hypothetical protein
MREKIRGGYRFNCDAKGCRANIELDHEDPKVAAAHLRGHGWVKQYLDGEFEDLCPEHAKAVGG